MKNRYRLFLAAIAGNILEYYDFTVYAVFSTVIGAHFFPATSEFSQTLNSLAVFAIGFITRPLGGIVFGFIGDKLGRRVALITSMLGMTLSTFTIAFIPTFEQIGYAAPAILVIMRLLQGLCISGEGAGAAIFLFEHMHHRPGLIGGLVHATNIAGTLLASFVGIFINLYFPHIDFAWRFAFMLGGMFGLIGFYLRLRVAETPMFIALSKKKSTLKVPFLSMARNTWKMMFVSFTVAAVASSVVYFVKTMNVFYTNILDLGQATALKYLSLSSFILMITMPISGFIADKIGRRKMMILATIIIITSIYPIIYNLASVNSFYRLLSVCGVGVLGGLISGVAYVFVIFLFKTEQKYSGVGFSYNLGVALFGGTTPMVSKYLVENVGVYYAPAFYIMFTASLFLLVLTLMQGKIKYTMIAVEQEFAASHNSITESKA